MISGILPLDKPLGWTSHDVVTCVRRVAGQKQVGHAGTLDPMASGLLLVLLGSATKLSSYVMAGAKTYRAEVVLGATTVTDDAEAPLLETYSVSHVTLDEIEHCLGSYVGEIQQTPPAYAAVRLHGQKLYELARKGVVVKPESRAVTIHAITMENWSPPRLRLCVRCGSGTYIRSLARDIGISLRVGGYLHALRRVASGGFIIEDASDLDRVTDSAYVLAATKPGDLAVAHLPALVLSPQEVRQVRQGQAVERKIERQGIIRLYDECGVLLALGRPEGSEVRSIRVFAEG